MRIIRRVSWMMAICFVTSMFSTCFVTVTHAGGPWKGRIVDLETKEPLEDAVVLAVWYKTYRGPAGEGSKVHRVKETLTDKDGYFEMPAYIAINFLPLIRYIKGPIFHIFKPKYLKIHMPETYLLEDATKEPVEKHSILGDFTYRLSPGLIELPRLKTDKDRRRNLIRPTFPKNMMPNYMKLYNQECINLGLQSTPYWGDDK